MPFEMEHSKIWQRTLGERAEDEHAGAREDLRNALRGMRATVSTLITEIPADCRGLTSHDITHLDALWEMADLLAGSDFPMNPVEAFAFGCAVLLHDSALTFIAYPGGLSSLKDSTIWKDIESAHRRKSSDVEGDRPFDEKEVGFEVLRRLHAQQAEKLATQSWEVGSSKDKIYLLESSELRKSYGKSIGRIAHSHHWSIDKVAEDLRENVGAGSNIPVDWTLSERKIACLLRCADIAHLDRRRAPTILLAAKEISETSKPHWQFQNKINKPVRTGEALVYSSGEDFDLSEAEAWWMAFDILKAVDKEIRDSNSLLSERRLSQLAVHRVAGTETPRALSRHISTAGWKPVDTEIRVTDPVHLARTLGGANLYGQDFLAPIRELAQNAVDAVRARRLLEDRAPDWGSVVITVEKDAEGAAWLLVDDNGIGMSERVLTGPLLDFGKSLWSSGILQDEFPGLQSKGIQPIGRFGIGFFSIFLLGDEVEITTRKIGSTDSLKTLAFRGLSRRPILRSASDTDVRMDYSTRIKVKLKEGGLLLRESNTRGNDISSPNRRTSAIEILRTMFSCVDVNIDVSDPSNGLSFEHAAGWLETPSDEFLLETNRDGRFDWEIDSVTESHRDLLRPLIDESGKVYGRAALNVVHSGRGRHSFSRVSVGGFVTIGNGNTDSFYVGVIAGSTNVASRATSQLDVPKNVLESWISGQLDVIDLTKVHPSDQLSMCHTIIRLGAESRNLPFCLAKGGLLNRTEFQALLRSKDSIAIPVRYTSREYDGEEGYKFEHVPLSRLTTDIMFFEIADDVVVISQSDTDLLISSTDDDEIEREITENGFVTIIRDDMLYTQEMRIMLDEIDHIWGGPPIYRLKRERYIKMNLYKADEDRWVLRIYKAGSV